MEWHDDKTSYKGEWKHGLPNGLGTSFTIKGPLSQKDKNLELAYSRIIF